MKKIVCITGTRPQLIKHAVLAKALQPHFVLESLYSGQHYHPALHEDLKKELSAGIQFHNIELNNLQAPAQRLGEMIIKIGGHLENAKPDAVLVYGDTDTTLAGALAVTKLNLPLIHIEAGERSYNRSMPEEHNRVVTDAMSDFLFCASLHAKENLTVEKNSGRSFYSGDLMKDLLLQTAQLFQTPILAKPYYYCTIHRNYTKHNTAKIEELLYMLNQFDEAVIFPVHPATAQTIAALTKKNAYKKISFLPPVRYADSIRYLKFAQAVFTDSGGLQKEAYWLGRRCITIRKETEWTDTLRGNWNQLTYENLATIPELLQATLGAHDAMLYGNGKAAANIAACLTELL